MPSLFWSTMSRLRGYSTSSSRQVMLKAGSLAVVSVPLVDAEDVVCGVVSAHYTEARVSTGPRILRAVHVGRR
ncbi:hypothetical protein [Mycobacterium simiae]|uniref:hypothetical protein n=1 Tax=Mycobacterium simiae TaxID=1784 RepID=UPI002622FE0B|nr:hypothetical protein [Mycobacterium simiae]